MASTLQGVKQRFGIIGRSDQLERALNKAIRIAPTDLTVLIQGESGVGKEVFSKIIHQLSPRKHNPFIAINCGAIPIGTINSELFGHEKGSFTGAAGERKGYFESANTGTIFLDEVAELPLDTQAYLLRVLESGEFIKLGSSKTQKTDVRVIAATNVDLIKNVEKGTFREDLFYRLNTVPIYVPSLRDRKEDIHLLYRKFATDFAEKYHRKAIQLDPLAISLLENYNWKGNIRQLKNVAEQLSALYDDDIISADQLIEIIPSMGRRNLPVSTEQNNENSFQEREILYKLLFDMKADLNDLKSLVYELIKTNNLTISDFSKLQSFSSYDRSNPSVLSNEDEIIYDSDQDGTMSPILITTENTAPYHSSEIVEESLSIDDMEKELIIKALKKHRNRRKDAALDLGISERTLYRKIKQYDI